MLDTSGLVTTTVLKAKLSDFKNKIPNIRSLVTTTVLGTIFVTKLRIKILTILLLNLIS